MQSSSIRILIILRAHLLEMFISIAFFGLAIFMWYGRSNSDLSLLAAASLLVAGVMVFLFAMKSILKYSRRR
jgi:xanthine/uracil permease